MPRKEIQRRLLPILFCIISMFAGTAYGLFYLPIGTLESLLTKSDSVITGTVKSFDEKSDRAEITVATTLKGDAHGTLTVSNITIRVTRKETKPRFAAGDRVLIFLSAEKENIRPVLGAEVLKSETDEKSVIHCVTEVLPHAALLADLANHRLEVDEKALTAAIDKLAASRNGYTQIVVGKLMRTELPSRLKPEICEVPIAVALKTGRPELKQGAMVWTSKFTALPATIRVEL